MLLDGVGIVAEFRERWFLACAWFYVVNFSFHNEQGCFIAMSLARLADGGCGKVRAYEEPWDMVQLLNFVSVDTTFVRSY